MGFTSNFTAPISSSVVSFQTVVFEMFFATVASAGCSLYHQTVYYLCGFPTCQDTADNLRLLARVIARNEVHVVVVDELLI